MGQQLNKIIKRRRRKAYLERKKAQAKAGALRTPRSKASTEDGVKAAAKKVAAKKPAAKKVAKAKKEEETAVEAAAPAPEAPAAE